MQHFERLMDVLDQLGTADMTPKTELALWIDMEPPTAFGKNSKASFGGRVVGDANRASTKDTIRTELRKVLDHPKIEDDAIEVVVVVCYPYTSAQAKKHKNARFNCLPRLQTPDVDAALTTVMDAAQAALVYANDSRVFSARTVKANGKNPGLGIIVRSYDAKDFELCP